MDDLIILKWENGEQKGLAVKTLSDEFKWDQLGDLYSWFTESHSFLSLHELKEILDNNVNNILKIIDGT